LALSVSASDENTCPLTRRQVLDRYFLEHRASLLDLAAFLDRLDRAQSDDADGARDDGREAALARAMALLTDGQTQRARRIQQVLSDPTEEPAESAKDLGPTNGAYHGGPGA
jgi:hypothetical protein